jgi:hypothetical protein
VLRRVAKFAVAVTVAAPGFSRAIDDGDVARWAKAGGVGYLIGAAWTEGEAHERGVVVSDRDAREAIQAPHDGLTREDRIYEARVALLSAGITQPIAQNAALSVMQPQIDAYVASHPKFGPERRSVRVMRLTNRQTARKALQALRRGLSLQSATKRYAHGRTRLISTEPGELNPKPLGRKIFSAGRGAYSRYGSVVFMVRTIEPPQPLPLKVQNAQAFELLASEAQRQAIAAYEAELKAKWRPRTTCADPASAPDFCSNSPTGQ